MYEFWGFKKKKFGFLGSNVRINGHSFFGCSENIYIYDNVFIGRDTYMDAISEIRIESGTMIGPRCTFIGSSHNYNSEDLKSLPFDNVVFDRQIHVKKNVWIGAGVMICPGTIVGEGAVIGAGTTIYGEIPPFSVVVSTGYKIIKMRDKNKYYELKKNNCLYNTMFSGSPFFKKEY